MRGIKWRRDNWGIATLSGWAVDIEYAPTRARVWHHVSCVVGVSCGTALMFTPS
jgi:hypothetical protein